MSTQSDQCEYIFSDKIQCPHPISENYKDKKKHCIFHSHNDEKIEEFSKLIQDEISKNNAAVEIFRRSLPISLKPENEKTELLKSKREEKKILFEGYYFPLHFQFGRNHQNNTQIYINPAISFKEAIFSDEIDLKNSHFEGNVDFTNTIFKKKADFTNSKFYGETIIFKSNFKDEADFTDVAFQNATPDFSEAKFYNQASFHKTHFSHGANFSNSLFKGYAYFHSAHFDKKIEFTNSTFYELANFVDVTCDGPAYFNKTFFMNIKNSNNGCCNFLRTSFKQTAGFENVIFKGNANFIETHFLHKAEFNHAQFFNNATFTRAEFLKNGLEAKRSIIFGNADFDECNFDKEANFGEVVFLGKKANFKNLKCKDQILRNCTFMSDINFGPDFSSLPFKYFESVNFIGRADFTNKKLDEYRFLNCLMTGCSFLRSDIVNTIFVNCSWDFSNARKIIADIKSNMFEENNNSIILEKFKSIEEPLKKNIKIAKKKTCSTIDEIYYWNKHAINIGEIQECCMQLKNNRDKSKDHLTADKFYYSEMEMIRAHERKKIKDKRYSLLIFWKIIIALLLISLIILPFIQNGIFPETIGFLIVIGLLLISFKLWRYLFYTLYKYLSGYGNKPLSACIKFLSIILIASILLIVFNGVIKIESKSVQSPTVTDMPFHKKLYYLSMWNLTNPFTSQNKQYEITSITAHFSIFLIQYIYRPLMIALIILAVRRKVKR